MLTNLLHFTTDRFRVHRPLTCGELWSGQPRSRVWKIKKYPTLHKFIHLFLWSVMIFSPWLMSSHYDRSFWSASPCLYCVFIVVFLVLGATRQAGSVAECSWHNKPAAPRQTYIQLLAPLLAGEKCECERCMFEVAFAPWVYNSEGQNDLTKSERMFSLLPNWTLALVLSRSSSPWPHVACAFWALETSAWYMKPRLASRIDPQGAPFHP